MCAQIMSLTWDNHHSLLISVLKELLESNIGVNCTIVAEGHQLKAHKVLLSSFSPFFEVLFKEIQEEHPIIILADTSYQDLEAIINYIYQGKLEIPQSQMKNVLETAKSLQLKGLSDTSKDNCSKKENIILPLQTQPNRLRRKRKPDVVAQNDLKESQSYRGSTQHQTSPVPSEYQGGQSPVNCMSSDVTLQVSSVQKPSSFLAPSTSYSLESNSLPLHDETVVKIEPQDDMFSTENVQEYEPERQENEEINIWDIRRNSHGQGIGDDANISLSTNVIVKREENSQEYVPLQDYASPYISNRQHVELPRPMRSRAFCSTLNASSTSGERATIVPCLQLGNATRDASYSFVDPAELESDEFIDTEMDMMPEDVTEEETTMMNEASLSSMEQGEVLTEDEYMAMRSEYSAGRSQTAAPREGSSLLCSSQTPGSSGTTAESSVYLSIKSVAETTGMQHNNVAHNVLKNFVCKVCQKSFCHASSLCRHMRIHTGFKSYGYTQFDYTAFLKSDRRRIDIGRKLFKCTECEYAATKKCHLIGHHRIHTGEKPFKCGQCLYASALKCNLIKHYRIHHGVKT